MFSSFSGSFRAGRRPKKKSAPAATSTIIFHYDVENSSSYGGSGTTLNDLTSNNLNATVVGAPTYNGSSFTLSASDYIQSPSLSAHISNTSEEHTIEMWVYPTGNGVLAQWNGTATPNSNYHFSVIEIVSGQVEFGLWNGSGITSTGATGSIAFNQWHHIALTYDGTTVRGYVNGSEVGTTNVSWDSPGDDGVNFYMNFGYRTITNQGDGSDFDGAVSIMKLYSGVRTPTEIQQSYDADIDRFDPQTTWTASDISTVAWIDASDSSNYQRSGTSLLSVTDKAGTYPIIEIGGNPNTNNTTLNGLNVFEFDGSGDYLQSGGTISQTYKPQVSSGNHWAIGVFRYDGTNSNKDSLWSYETNGSPKRDYAISSGTSSNSWEGELDLDGLSSNRISNTIGNLQVWNLLDLTRYQYHIVVCWFNKTGNQIGVRVDGSNAFAPVSDYTNSLQINQELRLMRNRASEELQGRLAEFFAVAGITGTSGTDISTLEKAEGYLAHKWGLTGSLPSTHPYKYVPPT